MNRAERRPWVLGLLLLLCSAGVVAAEVTVRVTDGNGGGMADAVVTVTGPAAAGPAAGSAAVAVHVDQVNKEFVPYVTVIRTGTEVRFPNSDNIRHHVYSFSDAKRFEIPLYGNSEAPSVTFEQPGVVALGCNVHDWMRAYVFVTDAPMYGITDESGRLQLDLPQGDFAFSAWHPDATAPVAAVEHSVGQAPLAVDIELREQKRWRAWRGEDELEEGY